MDVVGTLFGLIPILILAGLLALWKERAEAKKEKEKNQ